MPLVALLDTNVWVSAFLKPSGPPGQAVAAWRRDKFRAVTSPSQLMERGQVLMRPRLTRRFKYALGDVDMFIRLVAARATVVETKRSLKICRDPDDDEILEAAILGKGNISSLGMTISSATSISSRWPVTTGSESSQFGSFSAGSRG